MTSPDELPLRKFEVRSRTTNAVLGSVFAETVWHAAQIAAMRFFSRTGAQRVTGWTGAPGMFEPTSRAFDSSTVVYANERFYIAHWPSSQPVLRKKDPT